MKPTMHINTLCGEADVDVRGPSDENDEEHDGETGSLEKVCGRKHGELAEA